MKKDNKLYQIRKYGYLVTISFISIDAGYHDDVNVSVVIDEGTNLFLPPLRMNTDHTLSMVMTRMVMSIRQENICYFLDGIRQAEFMMEDFEQNYQMYMKKALEYYQSKSIAHN